MPRECEIWEGALIISSRYDNLSQNNYFSEKIFPRIWDFFLQQNLLILISINIVFLEVKRCNICFSLL